MLDPESRSGPEATPAIVIGTDFSPASRAAFDSGLEMARELGGRVVLVHAIRPLGAPGLELTRPDNTTEENETAEPTPDVGLSGSDWVDLAQAQGIEADVVVRAGRPASVIAEEAARVQAHTIVLGTLEKDGLEKAVLGSVAEEVEPRTSLPVIVVPGPPGPDAL
jgi:nucleotide-binding universal stress UspA family protein